MRKDSEREANLIINDAQQRAEAIVRDARDSLKKTYQDISEMKRLKSQFEVALKSLLTSHLDLLERNTGYLPHVPNLDMTMNGPAPTMRPGKPTIET